MFGSGDFQSLRPGQRQSPRQAGEGSDLPGRSLAGQQGKKLRDRVRVVTHADARSKLLQQRAFPFVERVKEFLLP